MANSWSLILVGMLIQTLIIIVLAELGLIQISAVQQVISRVVYGVVAVILILREG